MGCRMWLGWALAGCSSIACAFDYQIQTLSQGLEHPWAMVFLPDGRMLVTERAGRIQVLSAQGQLLGPLHNTPKAFTQGQAGYFDLALDPDFATDPWLYLSFASGSASANHTKVIRARLKGHSLSDTQELFSAQPLKQGAAHYGGRMAFLPDKTLILTLGDGYNWREKAQDLTSHFGKIVRIHADGSIPKDNPFAAHPTALKSIYSYGHRNVQGIYYDAAAKRLYSHEHGPRGGDELNLITQGANYGWPLATFGVDYSGARISPYTTLPETVAPLLQWTPSIAPSSLIQYQGSLFKGWQGDLLVSTLAERSVRRVRLKDGKLVGEEVLFEELDARIRSISQGPDGALYLLTDEADGRVLRVVPEPE